MHIFVGVDAIVFVEGGASFSVQDARAGLFESESSDVAFWQKWFLELRPTITVQFRAVGSKATLLDLAREIATGAVTGVYVAMDRDFDNFTGLAIQAPRVLYTFGYSWENDVWTREILEEVFYTLCNVCKATVKIQQIIEAGFDGFERDLHWPIYADLVCIKHAIPLLPRKTAQRLLATGGGAAPTISREELRRCIRVAKAARTGSLKIGTPVKLSVATDCCGHVVGAFGYTLLVHLLKKFCKGTTYPRNLIDSIAIDKFFSKIREGHFPALRQHYEQQIAA